MIGPTKDFDEWSFEDLVTACAWKVASALLAGDGLRAAVWQVCSTTIQWRKANDERQRRTG